MTNYNTKRFLTVFAATLCVLAVAMAGTAAAKSVYLSANHHTSQFDAWAINPDGTVTKQATYSLQHSTDPAGIGIDAITSTGNPIMFITSEFSGGVEIVDPVSLTYLGVSSGPSDLAGVDVDDADDIVYVLGRETNDLYIYSWDPVTQTLTQDAVIDLPGMSYGFSLAFDDTRDILWVTDTGNSMVRAYNVAVSSWNDIVEIPTLSRQLSHRPVDVAVDMSRNLVYTVGAWYGSSLLSKYDVGAGAETTVNLGVGGIGVAVDETTGYVYMTRGTSSSADDIQVWDCNSSPWSLVQDTPQIGNPAGIAIANVSYNPLHLAKNDIIQGSVIAVGDNFTYEITCDNLANLTMDVENVTILDTLPVQLDFVSATHGGVYDLSTHTVSWDIGTIPAGQVGPVIDLEVTVNQNAVPDTTLYNYVTIDGDQIPPTTVIDDEDDPSSDPGIYVTGPHFLCPQDYRFDTIAIPPFGWEWDPYPSVFRSATDVHFVNSGAGNAYNVTATITYAPVNVTIVDGNVTLGDIPAGSGAWSLDFFELEVDMTNPQNPNEGIEWRVEYDDTAGVHHVVENVPEFCPPD
ncbi:MAG: DUF11 domain-containing protein [Deltaproteobacteria bacterium]|nr:DUF11 domain-containing protein [Deltaproteobacteria bacterium]